MNNLNNKKILLEDLGIKDYKDIWAYQTSLLNSIIDVKKQNRKNDTKNPTKNYFLFVEHPNVYTLGKSGDLSNLLINEQQLTNTDLNKYAEFSLKLSNDFPFLYGAFAIILAIALGILAACIRKLISDFRKKKPKEEVKFPVK